MYYLTQIVKLYIPNEIPLAFGLNKVHSFPILDLWSRGGGIVAKNEQCSFCKNY